MLLLKVNLQDTAKSITSTSGRFATIFCDSIKRNQSTIQFAKSHSLAKNQGILSRKLRRQFNLNDTPRVSACSLNRTCATLNQSATSDWDFDSTKETEKYLSTFPDIIIDLKEATNKYDKHGIDQLFAKAMEYNVPKGNFTRVLTSVFTFKHFANESQASDYNMRLVHYLCWCAEMQLDSILVTDDIMDESLTRRNQKCWYLLKGVGLKAINDALIIENGIYYILKKYFGHRDFYGPLMELFHETFFVTGLGQSLEMAMTGKHVTEFTMDTYLTITDNKCTFFSIYFPIVTVMLMLGKNDPKLFEQVMTLSKVLGTYAQINNDMLDWCVRDGNDVEQNKCTWLALQCMERASPGQRQIIIECYGQKDPKKAERVKRLYDELDLYSVYREYEKETLDKLIRNFRKGEDPLQDLFIWATEMYFRIYGLKIFPPSK